MSTFDRDEARDLLDEFGIGDETGLLDALAACAADTPHTIDRDALGRELYGAPAKSAEGNAQIDRILALVRPVEGVTLRHCSWSECPGLDQSIAMHEQEDGPELHEFCRNAMIAPEAVRELTDLYSRLAKERKAGVSLTPDEADWVAQLLRSLIPPYPAFVIEELGAKAEDLVVRIEAAS